MLIELHVVEVSPYRRWTSGAANLEKIIFIMQNPCVLVHSWFRKGADADRRRQIELGGEGWV